MSLLGQPQLLTQTQPLSPRLTTSSGLGSLVPSGLLGGGLTRSPLSSLGTAPVSPGSLLAPPVGGSVPLSGLPVTSPLRVPTTPSILPVMGGTLSSAMKQPTAQPVSLSSLSGVPSPATSQLSMAPMMSNQQLEDIVKRGVLKPDELNLLLSDEGQKAKVTVEYIIRAARSKPEILKKAVETILMNRELKRIADAGFNVKPYKGKNLDELVKVAHASRVRRFLFDLIKTLGIDPLKYGTHNNAELILILSEEARIKGTTVIEWARVSGIMVPEDSLKYHQETHVGMLVTSRPLITAVTPHVGYGKSPKRLDTFTVSPQSLLTQTNIGTPASLAESAGVSGILSSQLPVAMPPGAGELVTASSLASLAPATEAKAALLTAMGDVPLASRHLKSSSRSPSKSGPGSLLTSVTAGSLATQLPTANAEAALLTAQGLTPISSRGLRQRSGSLSPSRRGEVAQIVTHAQPTLTGASLLAPPSPRSLLTPSASLLAPPSPRSLLTGVSLLAPPVLTPSMSPLLSAAPLTPMASLAPPPVRTISFEQLSNLYNMESDQRVKEALSQVLPSVDPTIASLLPSITSRADLDQISNAYINQTGEEGRAVLYTLLGGR